MVHLILSQFAAVPWHIALPTHRFGSLAKERVITILVDIRYHLTSLVAVFLSLGLGIVIGMSLAEDDTLRREQQNLIRSIEDKVTLVQKENGGLRAELATVQASLGDYERLLREAGKQLYGQGIGRAQVTIVSEAALSPAMEPLKEFLQSNGGGVHHLTWHNERLAQWEPRGEGGEDLGVPNERTLGAALAGIVQGERDASLLQMFLSKGVFTADGLSESTRPPDIVVFVPDADGMFSEAFREAMQNSAARAILALPSHIEPAAWEANDPSRWTVVPGADTFLGWFHVVEAIAEAVGVAEAHEFGVGDSP